MTIQLHMIESPMKRIEDVFYFISLKPRRWTEIKKEFNISSGTVSNYLNYLLSKKLIEKKIIDGKIVYDKLWLVEKGNFIQKIKNRIMIEIENLKIMKRMGLFSKGLDDKEILECFKLLKLDPDLKRLGNDWKKRLEGKENLDIGALATFLNFMIFYHLSGLIRVRGKLKFDENPDKLIEQLEKIITIKK